MEENKYKKINVYAKKRRTECKMLTEVPPE